MKQHLTLTLSCVIAALLIGCGGTQSPPIIDAEAELERTAKQFSRQPGIEVSQIEYSEETQQALAELEPAVGLPFRLSGTAQLTVTEDLTRTVDVLDQIDPETRRQISDAVEQYQISPDPLRPKRPTNVVDALRGAGSEPADAFPRAYATVHQKGDRQNIDWARDVLFYQDPDTGKLAAKVTDVRITYISESENLEFGFDHLGPFNIGIHELYKGLETSTEGYDVSDPKGREAFNLYFQQYLEKLITEGKERFRRGVQTLSGVLANDAVFSDGENYFRLTTPPDPGALISSDQPSESKPIPCQYAWIDAEGKALVTQEIRFRLSALKLEPDGSMTIELTSEDTSDEKQIPQFELPKSLESKYTIRLNSGDEHYALKAYRELAFVCWASELESKSLTNSDLAQNFIKLKQAQELVESTPVMCRFTSRRGEPYSMVMRVKREAGSKHGTIVTTNLDTGVQTTWKLDDIRYIRGQNIIIYEADRVGERTYKVHPFDADKDIRIDVHADGSIEFYGYKNAVTSPYQP